MRESQPNTSDTYLSEAIAAERAARQIKRETARAIALVAINAGGVHDLYAFVNRLTGIDTSSVQHTVLRMTGEELVVDSDFSFSINPDRRESLRPDLNAPEIAIGTNTIEMLEVRGLVERQQDIDRAQARLNTTMSSYRVDWPY